MNNLGRLWMLASPLVVLCLGAVAQRVAGRGPAFVVVIVGVWLYWRTETRFAPGAPTVLDGGLRFPDGSFVEASAVVHLAWSKGLWGALYAVACIDGPKLVRLRMFRGGSSGLTAIHAYLSDLGAELGLHSSCVHSPSKSNISRTAETWWLVGEQPPRGR